MKSPKYLPSSLNFSNMITIISSDERAPVFTAKTFEQEQHKATGIKGTILTSGLPGIIVDAAALTLSA